MNFRSTFIHSRDGTVLHVRHTPLAPGRPTGLFLHGFGDGGYVWNHTCAALGELCGKVIVELRGHGDSQPAAGGRYELDSYLADVSTVIASLRLENFFLVGHSLGGRVAAHLAWSLEGRVLALGLIDIAPDLNGQGVRQMRSLLREGLRPYRSHCEYRDWLMMTRPLLSEETAAALAEHGLRSCAGGFEPKMDPRLLDADHEPAIACSDESFARLLGRLRCPVRLFRGVGSAIISAAAAARTLELLREGELVTIPGAGHATMSDNPEAFSSAVLRWVAQIVDTVGGKLPVGLAQPPPGLLERGFK